MLSKVLDHDPSQDDSTAVLWRFKTAWDERDLERKGIPSDGAAREPEPIREVCGAVAQQRCPCHVSQARPHGGLRAVAAARARWATAKPPWPRGRPSSQAKAARRLARTSTWMQQNISAVGQERFLCVQRRRPQAERPRLLPITRGLPPLRQLRERMAQSSALLDRRCRTPTALGTLKTLRPWGHRCTWRGET
jgi:hypothetical protein